MAQRADADSSRDLLLALIALERGLVDQDRLLAAFGTWTQSHRPFDGRDPGEPGRPR